MIDIHCHILPGIDDGPKSMTESIVMAKRIVSQGVHTVVAAPHHNNGIFRNERDAIIGAVDYVNAKFQEEQLPLMVLPGQEIMMYEDMVKDLKLGLLLPLNETSGYVMLGMPNTHVPNYADQLIFDMQVAGYKPLITHPEKNTELVENPDALYRLVKHGAITQIDAASVMNGKKTTKFVMQLFEANLAHVIASNAPDIKRRDYKLHQAYKTIRKQIDHSTADVLIENSELLIKGQPIIKEPPQHLNNKKRWGFF